MKDINCADHQSSDGCYLDLLNHTELMTVSLTNISVSGLQIGPATKQLFLEEIKIAKLDGIVSLMGSVSNTHTLQTLTMKDIDCAEHQMLDICYLDLSKHIELKHVSLIKISCKELRLSPVTEVLVLSDIKLSTHDEIVSLMGSVSNTHTLRTLYMNNIDCAEHQSSDDCYLDLLNHTELKTVSLTNISVSGLQIGPATQQLFLEEIKIAKLDGIVSLMESVSNTHTLRTLYMTNIDCREYQSSDDCNLDLSNHTELKSVSLMKISVSVLQIGPATQHLCLDDIKVANNNGIVSLMGSVSDTHGLQTLAMNDIECADHHRLDDCYLDLSKHIELKTVLLINMSFKELRLSPFTEVLGLSDIKLSTHDEVVSLMEGVSSMHTLKFLLIKGYCCTEHETKEEYIIDLSKHIELKTVLLLNLSLKELRLSPVTEVLGLSDIKLSHDEIDSLVKGVSNRQTVMSSLITENISCTIHQGKEECKIDLPKNIEGRKLLDISISVLQLDDEDSKILLRDYIKEVTHDTEAFMKENV